MEDGSVFCSECGDSFECHFHDTKAPKIEEVEELEEDQSMKKFFEESCKSLKDLDKKKATIEQQLLKNQKNKMIVFKKYVDSVKILRSCAVVTT